MEKCKTISTVDFESAVRELEKDVRESDHLTKTYVIKRIDAMKDALVTYEKKEDHPIPEWLQL